MINHAKNIEDIYKYIRLKKFEQAETLVLSKLEEDSENGEYNFIFGLILAQKRDFTKALKYFQKTADGKDGTYDSYFNCGNCCFFLSNLGSCSLGKFNLTCFGNSGMY